MEQSSEEVQRAVEERHGGQSPLAPQGQSERLNGESPQLQQVHGDSEAEQHSLADSRTPSQDNPAAADCGDEQENATPARPPGPGDDEFENFHRSFTVGANPLDTLASRAAYGPSFPDSNSGQDPTNAPAPSADAAPQVAPQGVSEEQHQQPQQPQSSSPPTPPPPPSQDKEDPTVVQARRSMMARTGDRHARGKLPEPIDGRFLPPDCPPLEPQMPAPRSSKRYMDDKKRSPDVFEGSVREEDSSPLEDEEHMVSCRGCNLDVIVRKAAVVVRCKNCGKVNPASSVDRFDRSQFTAT